MADDDARGGRSAAWGVLAAVFVTAAALVWPMAGHGHGWVVLAACAISLVTLIGLYMCFATMWRWWPVGPAPASGPSDPPAPPAGGTGATGAGTSPAIARRPVRLAPRPAFLIGRETLLTEVDGKLASGDGIRPRVSVLYGLGGIGKTSLAVEYAHRHLEELGLAWQFAAEDPAVLTADFSALQAQLGIHDPSNAVESVHAALAGRAEQWLLILDNAPDLATVEPFLPPAGQGRILITSQNGIWPFGQGISVPVLTTGTAANFLITRTSDPDRQSARTLSEHLDGLPLALEQAGAYVLATGDTLAGYLALFLRRRSDVLSRGQPTGYRKTVATTWGLAFESLNQASPAAIGLMRLLAFCAPEEIPLRLLLRPHTGVADQVSRRVASVLQPLLTDELAGRDAVAALRRYSLATPASDGSVSIHRLVQGVIRDQMPADLASEWRRATAITIEAALPSNPRLPENWPVFAALLPHIQAAAEPHAASMAHVADYLGRSGSYLAARNLYQKVADAQAAHCGPEHPDTLASLNGLARWTGQTGNKAGARDMLADLLPVEEQVLGPEHGLTLETRSSIARWTGEAGDAAAARDRFAELLPVEERVLGPEDLETLDTRGALARWTGEAGDAAGAQALFMKALPIEQRVLGPDHPQTLDTGTCIARWTGHAGNPGAARDQLARLMPQIEQALGPEHPRTLAYQGNLAYWTWQAGDPACANEMFAELLPIMVRVLGRENHQTQGTRANLARTARAVKAASRA